MWYSKDDHKACFFSFVFADRMTFFWVLLSIPFPQLENGLPHLATCLCTFFLADKTSFGMENDVMKLSYCKASTRLF